MTRRQFAESWSRHDNHSRSQSVKLLLCNVAQERGRLCDATRTAYFDVSPHVGFWREMKKIPAHEFDEATVIHIGGMTALYNLKKDISSPGKVVKSLGVDHEIEYTLDYFTKIVQVAEAHRYVESGRKKGNVTITAAQTNKT